MIINIVCLGAVFGAQVNRRGAGPEYSRPKGVGADIGGVGRKLDIERVTPDQLEQRPVLRQGYLVGDASGIGVPHFQRVDRRMLRLLGVGTLQLVSGRTPIPEVSTEEQILSLIELELGEHGRIRV